MSISQMGEIGVLGGRGMQHHNPYHESSQLLSASTFSSHKHEVFINLINKKFEVLHVMGLKSVYKDN